LLAGVRILCARLRFIQNQIPTPISPRTTAPPAATAMINVRFDELFFSSLLPLLPLLLVVAESAEPDTPASFTLAGNDA